MKMVHSLLLLYVCYLIFLYSVSGRANQDELEYDADSGPLSLKTVLVFFTGADSIPPLGYSSATLNFNPTNQYPTASTCAIALSLPTKYTEYRQFKRQLNVALTMHGGFGLV